MKKVLAIICTYNPQDRNYNQSFEDFSHPWFDAIRSWQIQREEDLDIDIVIADDVSGPKTRAKLLEFQKQTNNFYLDFIDEWFSGPLIGFNHALYLFKDKHYDYYAYVTSDASFQNKGDLKILLNDMNENCGFISSQADYDMLQHFDFNERKPPTRVHLGEAVCSHIGIWTREFMEKYDFKYVDILGGLRTEGFYPYLCAAIKRNQLLSHRVCIHHIKAIDRYNKSLNQCDFMPLLSSYYKRDFYKMLEGGMKLGMGFEEAIGSISIYWNMFLNEPRWSTFEMLVIKAIALNPVFKTVFNVCNSINLIPKKIAYLVGKAQGKPNYHRHNPDCFDKKEYSKSDALYYFMKENLFLTKDELDYKKIPFQLVIPS